MGGAMDDDDDGTLMREWEAFLAERPETGKYVDHLLRIYNPDNNPKAGESIIKDILHEEGYWHDVDDDGKSAWYEGLSDGRALAVVCGVSDDLRTFGPEPAGFGEESERKVVLNGTGLLPVVFDEVFAFLPYAYSIGPGAAGGAPHRVYSGLKAYLQVVCGRVDGLPPDLTGYENDPALTQAFTPVPIPADDAPKALRRERNPHFHTAMRIASALCRHCRGGSHGGGNGASPCSWEDMRVLAETACRYDHAGMLAWAGKGMVVDEDTLQELLLSHPQADAISGEDWLRMAGRLLDAMDEAYSGMSIPHSPDYPDTVKCFTVAIVTMGLSRLMGEEPESLTFAEAAFDLFQEAGLFDDEEARPDKTPFRAYAPGMLNVKAFEDARIYGMPFAKEEIRMMMIGQ